MEKQASIAQAMRQSKQNADDEVATRSRHRTHKPPSASGRQRGTATPREHRRFKNASRRIHRRITSSPQRNSSARKFGRIHRRRRGLLKLGARARHSPAPPRLAPLICGRPPPLARLHHHHHLCESPPPSPFPSLPVAHTSSPDLLGTSPSRRFPTSPLVLPIAPRCPCILAGRRLPVRRAA